MKFYSSMWVRKVAKCLHISSFSNIYLQGEKFDFWGVSLCGKLFVNFDVVHRRIHCDCALSDFWPNLNLRLEYQIKLVLSPLRVSYKLPIRVREECYNVLCYHLWLSTQ